MALMRVLQKTKKEKQVSALSFFVISALTASTFAPISALSAQTQEVVNMDVTPGYDGESTLSSVRLETKLIESSVTTRGPTIIEDNPNAAFTVVEATYIVRARAFGGDVYLPTYREDVVFSANITEPKEGANAVVATQPSIELLKKLPQVKNKYLLKEYEEVDMKIKTSFKIIPKAMPSRLVFAPQLDSLLWYPVTYAGGKNDPGIDPETGARLTQIPLANVTYVAQEVTKLNFKTEPVILLKSNKAYTAIKQNVRFHGIANVIGIFRSIFSK